MAEPNYLLTTEVPEDRLRAMRRAYPIVVQSRRQLRAAFQQQPPLTAIVVKRGTSVWLALVALFWLKGIPAMDTLTRAAMEKAYGIKHDWAAGRSNPDGSFVFDPP